MVIPALCWAQEKPQRELPKLTIHNPVKSDCIAQTADVAVSGAIASDLMTFADENVEVRFYHVRDDGKWVPQGGCTTRIDAKGRFSVDFRPASPGWRAGHLFVEARLQSAKAVRARVDFEVAPPQPGDKMGELVLEPTIDSQVVIDGDDPRESYTIPSATEFRVRGTIPVVGLGANGPAPFVRAKVTTLPTGDRPEVSLQSGSCRGFIDSDGQWWYEMTLVVTTKRPGAHRLRITTDSVGIRRLPGPRDEAVLVETRLRIVPAQAEE
jgi:hypothetical protein